MTLLKRCAFCHVLPVKNGGVFCSHSCQERARKEGCLDVAAHSLNILGSSPLVKRDPLYYRGIRHHGGHSTLEACGIVNGGARGRQNDTRMRRPQPGC